VVCPCRSAFSFITGKPNDAAELGAGAGSIQSMVESARRLGI
jgi:hypothetical protein